MSRMYMLFILYLLGKAWIIIKKIAGQFSLYLPKLQDFKTKVCFKVDSKKEL